MRERTLQLLIVDDDAAVREGCRQVAQSLGYSAVVAGDPSTAYRLAEDENVDVVLLDLRLAGANGLHVLEEMKRRRPETEVVVITGFASVASAVQAMKLGASDYVTKPFHAEELKRLLERVARQLHMAEENRALRDKVRGRRGVGGLVGTAPEMEKLYRIISKVASSAHPVLIQGESGTGKELVARAIHFSGPYRDKPFIPVDCGALVPTLVESELFGYVRGAFTGAVRSKEGLLAIADGGTVFLDEIGELPVDLQAKLLRALQEKEIRPVGSNRSVPISVRILAATNRDLEAAVQHGSFRKDLYFRLNVVNLRIPPLRERKQDIPVLVAHFLERMGRATGVERILSDEALERLVAYDWPGNVRELENSLERASALSSGPMLQVADLPSTLQNPPQAASLAGAGDGIAPLKELEKEAILAAVRKLHGDKLRAARLLGIGKTTLYRKLKGYGIEH
ncbi:MAG: sigma-54 dependent transcriptional regulator [Acidobacteria bacterium]|nr:sigma-54 dependent transcriptional regulator [Acidobacteriota bacterium]